MILKVFHHSDETQHPSAYASRSTITQSACWGEGTMPAITTMSRSFETTQGPQAPAAPCSLLGTPYGSTLRHGCVAESRYKTEVGISRSFIAEKILIACGLSSIPDICSFALYLALIKPSVLDSIAHRSSLNAPVDPSNTHRNRADRFFTFQKGLFVDVFLRRGSILTEIEINIRRRRTYTTVLIIEVCPE